MFLLDCAFLIFCVASHAGDDAVQPRQPLKRLSKPDSLLRKTVYYAEMKRALNNGIARVYWWASIASHRTSHLLQLRQVSLALNIASRAPYRLSNSAVQGLQGLFCSRHRNPRLYHDCYCLYHIIITSTVPAHPHIGILM